MSPRPNSVCATASMKRLAKPLSRSGVWPLDGIAGYLPYDLLSVYLIQAPEGEQIAPPYRAIPQIEITEGPHLGYAVQWFTFAAILLIGYPFFVRREVQAREHKAQEEAGLEIEPSEDEHTSITAGQNI